MNIRFSYFGEVELRKQAQLPMKSKKKNQILKTGEKKSGVEEQKFWITILLIIHLI